MLRILLRKLIDFILFLQSWVVEVTMSVRRSKLVSQRSAEILVKTKLVPRLRFARSSITTPGVSSVSTIFEYFLDFFLALSTTGSNGDRANFQIFWFRMISFFHFFSVPVECELDGSCFPGKCFFKFGIGD